MVRPSEKFLKKLEGIPSLDVIENNCMICRYSFEPYYPDSCYLIAFTYCKKDRTTPNNEDNDWIVLSIFCPSCFEEYVVLSLLFDGLLKFYRKERCIGCNTYEVSVVLETLYCTIRKHEVIEDCYTERVRIFFCENCFPKFLDEKKGFFKSFCDDWIFEELEKEFLK